MKNRVKRKWTLAFLSFVMLSTVSLPFFNVYQLNQQPPVVFLIVLAFICSITVIGKNYLFRLLCYLFSYFFVLYCYFPFYRSFGLTWIAIFCQKILAVYSQIINKEINYIPDILALSILLFLLILLANLLIHYERWVFSYLLLIGYLLMLAVFNNLNLSFHVLILSCSAALIYLLQRYSIILPSKDKSKLFLVYVLVLFLTAGSSYLFPLLFPKVKDSLLIQTSSLRTYLNKQGLYQQIEEYGSPISSKTGFGEDDAQLGGPIKDSQAALFTALQTTPHYWRVETKSYYTGKGWKNNSEVTRGISEQPLRISTNPESQGSFTPEKMITLSFNESKTFLPYPYGNSVIPWEEVGRTEQIEAKQRINLLDKPTKIQLTWQESTFTADQLRQTPLQQTQEETQLPPNVSTRVQELAIRLTKNKKTLYDKVVAIEQYLKKEGNYRYSKTDTPYTPENEDYVDYFLFESNVGYCDNFSSAMIILLRSLGISSRWTKGFTQGDLDANSEEEYKEYIVRESHAHSWPEVYFEGFGWVPFEPTPGFTTIVSQKKTTEESVKNPSSESSTAETLSSSAPQKITASTSSDTKGEHTKITWGQGMIQWFPLFRKIAISLGVILTVIGGFFLKKYFFLLHFVFYRRIRPTDFIGAYIILLKKAEKVVYRHVNEPLTSYATRFEQIYPQFRGKFSQLTVLYESTFYGETKLKNADYAEILRYVATCLTHLKKFHD
ncbi:transglutaminase-like domain-containing protein [Candidatus Enterococcus mansonii]|uniref:Transglutaminase-like domain-containing protein n=1 Tax=Candidatus Enterococcus mansonii TaxID=1834181 RepID=A0A242CCS3_9ENTE|nr:transglutaminase family protein [Enterococcus sp. 4G2_DIV0659]OTO08047.1 hypothetical protein A5880_002317 [Enterococcus sp. 4G2_DIV0659]